MRSSASISLSIIACLFVAPAFASAACSVDTPPLTVARPGVWLGTCAGGQADGLGVIRLGAREPYSFFAGRVHGGKLVRGVGMEDGMFFKAYGFKPDGDLIEPDSLQPGQSDVVIATAVAGAKATARWFATRGNAASSSYYRKLAVHIVNMQPE